MKRLILSVLFTLLVSNTFAITMFWQSADTGYPIIMYSPDLQIINAQFHKNAEFVTVKDVYWINCCPFMRGSVDFYVGNYEDQAVNVFIVCDNANKVCTMQISSPEWPRNIYFVLNNYVKTTDDEDLSKIGNYRPTRPL